MQSHFQNKLSYIRDVSLKLSIQRAILLIKGTISKQMPKMSTHDRRELAVCMRISCMF